MNEHQSNYIQAVKTLETQGKIEFDKIEMSFIIKFINGLGELKYIEGFEIIDNNFANFLSKKFSSMEIPLALIGKINSNFFLNLNLENNIFNEILSLNENNIFTLEYLIEIEKNTLFKDANSLNNYIFNIFMKNKTNTLISRGNPLSLEDNQIIINFYKKSKNSESNLNQNKMIKMKLHFKQ